MLRLIALVPLLALLVLAAASPAMLSRNDFEALLIQETEANEQLWGVWFSASISSTGNEIVQFFSGDSVRSNKAPVMHLPGDAEALLTRNISASLSRLSQSSYVTAMGAHWRLIAFRVSTALWLLFPVAFVMICAVGIDAAVCRRVRARTFRSPRPEVVMACFVIVILTVAAMMVYPFAPIYVSPLAIPGLSALGLLGVHGALSNYHQFH